MKRILVRLGGLLALVWLGWAGATYYFSSAQKAREEKLAAADNPGRIEAIEQNLLERGAKDKRKAALIAELDYLPPEQWQKILGTEIGFLPAALSAHLKNNFPNDAIRSFQDYGKEFLLDFYSSHDQEDHPALGVGDFNGDGVTDYAVALRDSYVVLSGPPAGPFTTRFTDAAKFPNPYIWTPNGELRLAAQDKDSLLLVWDVGQGQYVYSE